MSTDAGFVERMSWDEVAFRLDTGAAAILPIGAAAKQHGLHLPLNTDRVQAELLAARLAESVDALIWPTLAYGHYPAFTEYAGSVSLSAPVFEAIVQEIAQQHGATVHMDDAHPERARPGLRVSVRFVAKRANE